MGATFVGFEATSFMTDQPDGCLFSKEWVKAGRGGKRPDGTLADRIGKRKPTMRLAELRFWQADPPGQPVAVFAVPVFAGAGAVDGAATRIRRVKQ